MTRPSLLIRDTPCRVTIESTDIPLLVELIEMLNKFKVTAGATTTITLHEEQGETSWNLFNHSNPDEQESFS